MILKHWRWIYVSNIGNRDRSVMICGGWGQRMRLKKQIGAIQNRENELESEIWRQTTSDKCMRETDLIENKSNLSEPDVMKECNKLSIKNRYKEYKKMNGTCSFLLLDRFIISDLC
eukprot:622136_1